MTLVSVDMMLCRLIRGTKNSEELAGSIIRLVQEEPIALDKWVFQRGWSSGPVAFYCALGGQLTHSGLP